MKAILLGAGTFLGIVFVGSTIAVKLDLNDNYKGTGLIASAIVAAYIVHKNIKDNEQKMEDHVQQPEAPSEVQEHIKVSTTSDKTKEISNLHRERPSPRNNKKRAKDPIVDTLLKRPARHEISVGTKKHSGSLENILDKNPSQTITLRRSANVKLTIRRKQHLFVVEFVEDGISKHRSRPRNRQSVLMIVEEFLRLRDPSDIILKL